MDNLPPPVPPRRTRSAPDRIRASPHVNWIENMRKTVAPCRSCGPLDLLALPLFDAACDNGGSSSSSSDEGEQGASRRRPRHCWSPANHRTFRVRAGPNYRKTGLKAPSADFIYQPVRVHPFITPLRAPDFLRYSSRFLSPQPLSEQTSLYLVDENFPAKLLD